MPRKALITSRLVLHLPSPAHAAAVARFYEDNVAHFSRWDPPRPAEFTTETYWRQRLASYASEVHAGTAIRFFVRPLSSLANVPAAQRATQAGEAGEAGDAGETSQSGTPDDMIEIREDAPVIAAVNFNDVCRGPFQSCALGYAVDHRWEGQGVMSEALRAAITHVFEAEGLHRIAAGYLPINERSGQLLRRLGFAAEGYARDYLFINGAWRDHVLTSLLNPSAPTPGPARGSSLAARRDGDPA